MSNQTDRLVSLLEPFGLSTDESRVYLSLLEKSALTALQISRDLHIGRTKVYRVLDKLEDLGLAIEKKGDRGARFEATTPKQLELLIKKKEGEVGKLKESLPVVLEELSSVEVSGDETSKVLYYEGQEGLEQVTWNSLKAEDELRIFEIKDMSAFLDYGFTEKVREEFVWRDVHVRELTNQKELDSWTNVQEFVDKYWQCRYIDPKELEMRFELLVYNDVYTMYSFEGRDIFCVEIYNQNLAQMQKQLFDFMWLHARKMERIGGGGAMKVVSD